MTDEETTSDTLREDLEDAHPTPTIARVNYAKAIGAVNAVAEDAIERVAQLERRIENLEDEVAGGDEHIGRLIEERNEARVERDRLAQAIAGKANETVNCGVCGGHEPDALRGEPEYGHYQGCPAEVLREVERGDAVEHIRREAFERAAQIVDPPPGGQGSTNLKAQKLAAEIRALAEAEAGHAEDPRPSIQEWRANDLVAVNRGVWEEVRGGAVDEATSAEDGDA